MSIFFNLVNPNLADIAVRKKIIDEIKGNENISRKRFEQRKFDVYRNRQAAYVLERLADEFSPQTVKRMRKVLSINPCKRIVDQLGSIYAQEPDRHFSKTGTEGKSDEDFEKSLADMYHCSGVDPTMRLLNRYYKLCDQAALYIVPSKGKIKWRALTPKDYDVIPDADDPEQAFGYVLNIFDVNLFGPTQNTTKEDPNRYYSNTKTPEQIANDSDRIKLLQRFVWWTADQHFTTNGFGVTVDGSKVDDPNPIGVLPFVDVAQEKDYQFFVRRGNSVVEFVIDLLVQLCDLAEISRLQGYSQAIIYSVDEPKDLVVGPNKVMWIKQPADGQASQPKFAFESPSPDLKNSLEIINTQLKMFLSSMGLDSSTVSGDSPKRAFTSGIDHLLANIDKFQASQEDFDLFRRVETDAFEIHRIWCNEFQGTTGDDALDDDYQIGKIDDEVELSVSFAEPQIVQTQKDKEDSVIKRWDNDLLTTKDALIELYDFDEDKADEYITELIADRDTFPRPALPGLGQPGTETPPKGGAPGNGQPPADGKAPPVNGGAPADGKSAAQNDPANQSPDGKDPKGKEA